MGMNDRNLVLAGMGEADRAALKGYMQEVSLTSGAVLYEPDYRVEWVYSPTRPWSRL